MYEVDILGEDAILKWANKLQVIPYLTLLLLEAKHLSVAHFVTQSCPLFDENEEGS